ncbi:hypothetical protein [Demequina phytophila]|uniref:hypothetical protein n=1 Tax=Demequina phytophila TaxID=1638981 RepID=UPI000785CD8C|nr:hypothetical protein [Demequina phytophila]
MADATRPRCLYSASGHLVHIIQIKRALRDGPPRDMRIVGTHERGIYVATLDARDQVETWCMHDEWREIAHAAIARHRTHIRAYTYGLAEIMDRKVSYVPPDRWRECPAFEDLKVWERPWVTRAELEAEIAAGRWPGAKPESE